MNEVAVTLEFTPNPDTLKYSTNTTLVPSGVANFTSVEKAQEKSPLAFELFQIQPISAVMLGKDFVTVTLANQDNIMEINDKIMNCIKSFLSSGKSPLQTGGQVSSQPATVYTDIEQKIVDILDSEIRPAVAMDGGDISFEKYEDGFVYLKMQGSCAGCPSSMMTLKMGVETRLREAIPEIQEVIPV